MELCGNTVAATMGRREQTCAMSSTATAFWTEGSRKSSLTSDRKLRGSGNSFRFVVSMPTTTSLGVLQIAAFELFAAEADCVELSAAQFTMCENDRWLHCGFVTPKCSVICKRHLSVLDEYVFTLRCIPTPVLRDLWPASLSKSRRYNQRYSKPLLHFV